MFLVFVNNRNSMVMFFAALREWTKHLKNVTKNVENKIRHGNSVETEPVGYVPELILSQTAEALTLPT